MSLSCSTGAQLRSRFPLGNIMIVDDEQDILDVFEEMFMLWGYSLQSYSNPKEALREIRTKPEKYRIVLIDFRMKNIDGVQLAEEICRINRGIRIVFMTAYEIKNEIKEKLDTLPIQPEILRKPFRMDELRSLLESSQLSDIMEEKSG